LVGIPPKPNYIVALIDFCIVVVVFLSEPMYLYLGEVGVYDGIGIWFAPTCEGDDAAKQADH
jgi:hypothetical protein